MDDVTIALLPRKRKYRRGQPPPPCAVPGCEKQTKTRGLCAMHYARMSRHGNTEGLLDSGTPIERFHKKYKVNPATGCWEWTCYRHPRGYGILAIGKKKRVRAHRFAYENLVGPIPEDLLVLHRCDNRRCVNPAHLFLGDDGDNIRDMWAKGRARLTGKRLTWPQVTTMRVLYARGRHSFTLLASIYGVDEEQARKIVKGEAWLNP